MKDSLVFETEHEWEFDLARETLQSAGIPHSHFTREEQPLGFGVLFRIGPTPEPRLLWCLAVPRSSQEEARRVLTELSLKTDLPSGSLFPDAYPRARVWAGVILLLIGLTFLVEIVRRML
jgi:hypothetical protein